jgi:hypothetical protein
VAWHDAFAPRGEQRLTYAGFHRAEIDAALEVLRTSTDLATRCVRPDLHKFDGWRFPDGT